MPEAPSRSTRRVILVVALFAEIAACGGPLGPIAGGRIDGLPHRAEVPDWRFASHFKYAIVEMRPSDPYSVTVNYYLVAGRLYLDIGRNAGWHRWRSYIRDDPRVRVRFGDRIYRAVAAPVTDPSEIAALLPAYFAKDSSEPTPGCSDPFPPRCFPDTSFVRLDTVGRVSPAMSSQPPGVD